MSDQPRDARRPDDDRREHDVLEALNAEGVVEHPGRPEDALEQSDTPAAEADAPPPPG